MNWGHHAKRMARERNFSCFVFIYIPLWMVEWDMHWSNSVHLRISIQAMRFLQHRIAVELKCKEFLITLLNPKILAVDYGSLCVCSPWELGTTSFINAGSPRSQRRHNDPQREALRNASWTLWFFVDFVTCTNKRFGLTHFSKSRISIYERGSGYQDSFRRGLPCA